MMNDTLVSTYAAKAKQYIWQDVKHSILIGIGAFVLIISIGLFPNNQEMLPGLSIAASFMFIIMLLKALMDWKSSFYLIETDNFTLEAIPYTRINGTYDYYFSINSITNIYSISQSGDFKKSSERFAETTFNVVISFYQGLEGNNSKLVVLFSPTKTLLGGFDNDGNFIANS